MRMSFQENRRRRNGIDDYEQLLDFVGKGSTDNSSW